MSCNVRFVAMFCTFNGNTPPLIQFFVIDTLLQATHITNPSSVCTSAEEVLQKSLGENGRILTDITLHIIDSLDKLLTSVAALSTRISLSVTTSIVVLLFEVYLTCISIIINYIVCSKFLH